MKKMEQKPPQEIKNSLLKIRSFLIPKDDENKVMYLHAAVALIGSLSAFFILEAGQMSLGIMEHSFLVLIEKTCVIVVVAYIISRTSFFRGILQKNFTLKNQFLMIATFGAISIFGTYSGINIFGAIANVRDLAPMIAGLVGGPWVGLAVGLIGGVQRYFLGGFTAIPCASATVLAGLFGGMIYVLNRGKFIGIIGAVLFAALMESFHMIMVLLISHPYPIALTVAQDLSGPMILSNSLGMLIFAFIISNLLNEQKTKKERDQYFSELERHKFELKTAHKIQRSFLPNDIPPVESLDIAAINIPAKDTGGDFYDFIPLSNDKLAIVIADVSDRKVPASLLMALSRTIIRSKSESTKNLKTTELVKYLNRLITQDGKSDVSLTLFYGILNYKTKEMNYINAGHSPPLIIKNKTKEIKTLEKDDTLVGGIKNLKLKEKHLSLENDDVIIFHTDGITSVVNSKGENFKIENLKEILGENYQISAEELITKLKESVLGFCVDNTPEDDISLIVLKVN